MRELRRENRGNHSRSVANKGFSGAKQADLERFPEFFEATFCHPRKRVWKLFGIKGLQGVRSQCGKAAEALKLSSTGLLASSSAMVVSQCGKAVEALKPCYRVETQQSKHVSQCGKAVEALKLSAHLGIVSKANMSQCGKAVEALKLLRQEAQSKVATQLESQSGMAVEALKLNSSPLECSRRCVAMRKGRRGIEPSLLNGLMGGIVEFAGGANDFSARCQDGQFLNDFA